MHGRSCLKGITDHPDIKCFITELEKCPGISRDFFRVSRDFPCFPGGFEFFWRRNVPPPQNVEVLVISVYTAYGRRKVASKQLVGGQHVVMMTS